MSNTIKAQTETHYRRTSQRRTISIRLNDEDWQTLVDARAKVEKARLGKMDLSAALRPMLREVVKKYASEADEELERLEKEKKEKAKRG